MIYITGDIHGHNSIRKLKRLDKISNENDVVIILGDFGLVFHERQTGQEAYWLKWLSKKKYYTLFIDGNHDNHNKLKTYPSIDIDKHGIKGKFKRINKKVFYIERGTIFTIDEHKFIGIGGAKSMDYDKQFRKEGKDWWPTEMLNKEERTRIITNLRNHLGPIHILSHTCPERLMKAIQKYLPSHIEDSMDKTRIFLNIIDNLMKDYKWYIGHFHINKKINDRYHFLFNHIIDINGNRI